MFKLASFAGAFVCAIALALVFHPLVFGAFVFWPRLVFASLIILALLLLIVSMLRKPFHRVVVLLGAVGLAVTPLAGCNTSAQVAAGIATGCGIVTDLSAAPVSLNAIQRAAMTTLVNTCANPPTNVAAISVDFVQAVVTLQPIVIAMMKAKPATALKMTALIDQWPDAPAELRNAAVAARARR